MPGRGDDLQTGASAAVMEHLANRTGLYTGPGGSPQVTLEGRFRRPYAEAGGDQAPTAGRRITFTTWERKPGTDIAPVRGGTMTFTDHVGQVEAYTIEEAEPDGNGLTDLKLEPT